MPDMLIGNVVMWKDLSGFWLYYRRWGSLGCWLADGTQVWRNFSIADHLL